MERRSPQAGIESLVAHEDAPEPAEHLRQYGPIRPGRGDAGNGNAALAGRVAFAAGSGAGAGAVRFVRAGQAVARSILEGQPGRSAEARLEAIAGGPYRVNRVFR